ncbi:MAG: cytochrome c [Bauldia sp.]|nr:cytochrome c [Bauldia sp.]
MLMLGKTRRSRTLRMAGVAALMAGAAAVIGSANVAAQHSAPPPSDPAPQEEAAAEAEAGDDLPGAGADGPVSALDGVYTVAQADAGLEIYFGNCSACHAGNMRGSGFTPGLLGRRFIAKWDSAAELVAFMQSAMPPAAPGSLEPEQYMLIVAAVLRANNFPASETIQLQLDTLDQVVIELAQ